MPLLSFRGLEITQNNTRKSTKLKKNQDSFLIRLLALLGITHSAQTGKRRAAFILAISAVVVMAAAIVFGPVLKAYPPFTSAPGQTNINATATSQANVQPNEYLWATSGTPVFSDPLSYNSRGNGWKETSNCAFSGGAYHVTTAQPGVFLVCAAGPACGFVACNAASTFSNFALQVQMTMLSGDFGGIVFRTSQQQPDGYRFATRASGGDLVYGTTQLVTFSTPISPKQTHLLTVIAVGSTIWLYVDKQLITAAQDSSASSGGFGFMAGSFSNTIDVAFKKLQVWTLKV